MTKTCFYWEIGKNCSYNLTDISIGCNCTFNSQILPCNTCSFVFGTCTINAYICNSFTGTKYTVMCFCNRHTVNCNFCNMSLTMATSSNFSPTRHGMISSLITSGSHDSSSVTSFIGLTAISNNGPSLITGSSSLILTPFISTSTVTQPNIIIISPVIVGVIPTVCILIITVLSLLVVLFIILYRRNKISVNQRGTARYDTSYIMYCESTLFPYTVHCSRWTTYIIPTLCETTVRYVNSTQM